MKSPGEGFYHKGGGYCKTLSLFHALIVQKLRVFILFYFVSVFWCFLLLVSVTMATEQSVQVLRGNAGFGKNLYNVLARGSNENIVFSPLSAHTVLALAYQGAAGNTAKAFASTLQLSEAKAAADGYKTSWDR